MDDDVDPLGRQLEQMVRLDQLEALVHHRRRVDRNLRAHIPSRMSDRLLPVSPARISSRLRSRNGPPLHVRVIFSIVLDAVEIETLPDRIVLAVHRQQGRAVRGDLAP